LLFGRLRQRILLKCVPHVQHDFFSSLIYPMKCFIALSLPFRLPCLNSLILTLSLTGSKIGLCQNIIFKLFFNVFSVRWIFFSCCSSCSTPSHDRHKAKANVCLLANIFISLCSGTEHHAYKAWWEYGTWPRVVQYTRIMSLLIHCIGVTKCPPNPNSSQNSNNFATYEERDTLWCLLWRTKNLIMSEYWTCMTWPVARFDFRTNAWAICLEFCWLCTLLRVFSPEGSLVFLSHKNHIGHNFMQVVLQV